MKKPYTLDYSIEKDVDRMNHIREQLDKMNTTPSNSDLELMASYVLYGKDENGKNSIQRGETDDRESRRYKTYKKADEKVVSFDEWLEIPGSEESSVKPWNNKRIYKAKKRTINRPKTNKDGTYDPGDSDIPGMVELWQAIDHLEHTLAANEGTLDFNADDTVIKDSYRMWQLKHVLADVRRHQYYLKDYYKPTLHFNSIAPASTPSYNWDEDTYYWMPRSQWQKKVDNSYFNYISKNIEDYEVRENPITKEQEVKWVVKRHVFDWENPAHIRALIYYYSDIYMQLYEKLDSWGRTLIYDFDRYCDLCNLTEIRTFILIKKIDHENAAIISAELQEKFGITYNEGTINSIVNKEIPEAIAQVALKQRLLRDTPWSERKTCPRCGRSLPAMPPFYGRNKTKVMGVNSSCRECERKRRVTLGELKEYDRRSKDAQMRKM